MSYELRGKKQELGAQRKGLGIRCQKVCWL
jgi:hypothetical protein